MDAGSPSAFNEMTVSECIQDRIPTQAIEARHVEDDKYAEARLKLETLQRDVWFLRYGDYFAADVKTFREEALELKEEAQRIQEEAQHQSTGSTESNGGTTSVTANVPGPTHPVEGTSASHQPPPSSTKNAVLEEFCSLSWGEIQNMLDGEKNNPDSEKPMTKLIGKVAGTIPGFKFIGCYHAISLYTQQSDIAHWHIRS